MPNYTSKKIFVKLATKRVSKNAHYGQNLDSQKILKIKSLAG
jgi:hypothetical protein